MELKELMNKTKKEAVKIVFEDIEKSNVELADKITRFLIVENPVFEIKGRKYDFKDKDLQALIEKHSEFDKALRQYKKKRFGGDRKNGKGK